MDNGELEIGQTIKFGYYRQQGLTFDEDKRVIDIITDIAEVIHMGKGRQMSPVEFLNYFLFPPSMHYVKVRKLSGGEKRRLYLMTVLVRQPNFLILDEPTNDLDIMTLAVLEEYLADFEGCVVIVSHDRFFMDVIVDHLFVFAGNGKVKDFPGNYSQYREWKKQKEEQEVKARKKEAVEKQTTSAKEEQEKKKQRYANRLSFNEKREYEQLEVEITSLEEEKSELEKQMNAGDLPHQELSEKANRVAAIIEEVDEKTMRWLELDERA
jgi:ATP-binding cassette subfamily F protein uup